MCWKFKATSAVAVNSQGWFSSWKHGAYQRAAESAPSRSTNKYTKAAAPSVYQICGTFFVHYLLIKSDHLINNGYLFLNMQKKELQM